MIDLRPLEVIFSSPEHFVLTTLSLVLLALFLNAAGLGLKKILIVYLNLIFLAFFFLSYPSMIYKVPFHSHNTPYLLTIFNDYLFLISVLLGILVSWMAISWGIQLRWSNRILSGTAATLGLAALACSGFVIYLQLSQSVVDQRIYLQSGMPLIILGSLIIIFFLVQPEPVEDHK
jgi:hypothetical protein